MVPRRATLIVNPFSTGVTRARVADVEYALGERVVVTTRFTERPGHATELAREAARTADAIVLYSGDGTYNEAINGAAGLVPFGFLAKADPRQVLSFLQDEHPQTIALVLAHMPAVGASQVLSGLSGMLQADVAHRIAMMDRTAPASENQTPKICRIRLATNWRFFQSTKGCVPLLIRGAVRFLTSGTSWALSFTTMSRSRSQEARISCS